MYMGVFRANDCALGLLSIRVDMVATFLWLCHDESTI